LRLIIALPSFNFSTINMFISLRCYIRIFVYINNRRRKTTR
jgi:hypothetical protein